jgi:hypothetical protein
MHIYALCRQYILLRSACCHLHCQHHDHSPALKEERVTATEDGVRRHEPDPSGYSPGHERCGPPREHGCEQRRQEPDSNASTVPRDGAGRRRLKPAQAIEEQDEARTKIVAAASPRDLRTAMMELPVRKRNPITSSRDVAVVDAMTRRVTRATRGATNESDDDILRLFWN